MVDSVPDFTITTDGFYRMCVQTKKSGIENTAIAEDQLMSECLASLTHNYMKCLTDKLDFNSHNTIVGVRVVGTHFSFYSLHATELYDAPHLQNAFILTIACLQRCAIECECDTTFLLNVSANALFKYFRP